MCVSASRAGLENGESQLAERISSDTESTADTFTATLSGSQTTRTLNVGAFDVDGQLAEFPMQSVQSTATD